MKLKQSDILQIIALIRINNEKAYQITEGEMTVLVNFWYESLCAYPKEIVFEATKNAIRNSEFTPRLATIINEIKKLSSIGKKSDIELWAELKDVLWNVRDAAYDLRYDSSWQDASNRISRIYSNLSSEIKLYVVNTSSLIEIANLDDEELKFEKARFLKLLPTLREHAEERKQAEDFQLLLESKQLGINLTSQKRIGGNLWLKGNHSD
jgi:hypothetical protein